jgi:hypothetical protein
VAFLGIGALIGGGLLGGIVDFGITMAASIGLSYAAQALAGKPKSPAEQATHFSTQIQLQSGGVVPRSFLMGKTATGGLLTYFNTWGNSGETPNAYYTQVIKLSDLPIKALLGVWINGEKCTLGADTGTGMGSPVAEYNKDGADHVWVKFYDGTQTTADSFLTTKVSSAARPYGSTRVGIGIAYVICTALVDDTLFSTGTPTYKFETDGVRLYDPTKDSTNGGSGSQRYSDPSTWGGDGDDYPAVQAYNILRGIQYSGSWIYGLQKTVQANLPTVNWNAQIGKCRTTIVGAGGAEATYRSGGQFAVNAPPADALDALMTACQGKVCEVGGFYKVHLGTPDSFSFEFTDDDILSTEEQTYTPFLTLADSINGITGTYPDPTQGWNNADAPAIYNAGYEALDGNRRLLASPTFDIVPYAEQVQRLMRSALYAARRERKHNLVLPPPFWMVEPGDVGRWTSARNGYTNKDFEVIAISDKANIDVGVSLQEVDPTDYAWDTATDYTPGTSGPTVYPRPAPQGIAEWAAEGVSILDADGYARRPGIRLSWDGDMPGVTGIRYQVRRKDDASPVTSGNTLELSAGAIIITQSLLPGNQYEVAGQYIPSAPRDMLWSDWITVSTPDTKFSVLDFAAAVRAQITTIQQQVQDVVNTTESLIASVAANQDARNWTDKQQVRSQLMARAGSLSASITNVQTVAADATAALASDVSTLSVTVGANTGSITTVQNAVASLSAGISLSYGVNLDSSGYVIGFKLLNGGASTGTAIFNVDNFQIASASAPSIKPFLVNIVGGVSNVVLDADNILLNGSVKATKLSVATLSAITANLGTVTAGQLNSTNGKFSGALNDGTFIWSD